MPCSICGEKGHNRKTCKKYVSSVKPDVQQSILPVTSEVGEDRDKKHDVVREQLMRHLEVTKVGHSSLILKEPTLKDAHIYCLLNRISSQKFGTLLEWYIIQKHKCVRNKKDDCIGDYTKDGINVEVKVSLGGETHTKFNYVQIRPFHNVQYYLLTAYVLTSENIKEKGELFIFKVSKDTIIDLILDYGGYAHGTESANGPITRDTICSKEKKFEYALRPILHKDCWKELLKYRIEETDIC